MIKVLYIFSGADRREIEPEVEAHRWPDNWLYGYCQVKNAPGIGATYMQVDRKSFRGNLRLFATHYKRLKEADVIFITSSLHFNLILAKKFGLLRSQKWIFLNLDLTNKLRNSSKLLKAINLADKIISPSRIQNDFLITRGVRRDRLEFVPFGIDKRFYQPLPQAVEGVIFAVGRDAGRDYGTFIEAVRGLDQKVVIMCREKNLKGVTDIPSNVQIIDERTPLLTREFYEQAILSVVPGFDERKSLGSDCSGHTVILESMAYGRPVIASEKQMFKDYFDTSSLVSVDPENPQALRNAIQKVISDSGLRNLLSLEGRKLIEGKYNSDRMGERFIQIIEEVASVSA